MNPAFEADATQTLAVRSTRLYGLALVAAVVYAVVSFRTTYVFGAAPRPLGTGGARLLIEISYQTMQIAYLGALWIRLQISAAAAAAGGVGAGKVRGRPSTGFAIVGHDLRRLLPFFIVALVTPPLSTDPALYLKYGQMALAGVNPYLTLPRATPDAVFHELIAWNQSSVYGPVAMFFFLPPAALARVAGLASGIYLLKLQLLAVHVGTAALLRWAVPGRLLVGHGRRVAVLLYAANPLLLSYGVADAHIDGLLCLFVVLALGSVMRGLLPEAIMAASAGALVKALPLLWLPALFGALIHRARQARSRWLVPLGLVAPLLIVATATLVALPSWAAWRQLANSAVTGSTRSLYAIAELVVAGLTGASAESLTTGGAAVETAVRVVIVAGILVCAGLRAVGRLSLSLPAELALWTLALFALGTRWVVPWYAGVFVACAPFLFDQPRLLVPLFAYWVGCGFMVGSTGGSNGTRIAVSVLTLAPLAFVPLLLRIGARRTAPALAVLAEGHDRPRAIS